MKKNKKPNKPSFSIPCLLVILYFGIGMILNAILLIISPKEKLPSLKEDSIGFAVISVIAMLPAIYWFPFKRNNRLKLRYFKTCVSYCYKGMEQSEVEEMMSDFNVINMGYDKFDRFIIHYKQTKRKDYEEAQFIFCDGQLEQVASGYHRTKQYTYYN